MKSNLQRKKERSKPRILITFRIGGENGGPYVSHKRIMESDLKEQYEFIPLMLPKPKEILTVSGMKQVINEIKKNDPDILHFAGLQLEGFAVLLAAKMAGVKKTICSIRGSSMDAIGFSGLKRSILMLLENWTLKNASACYGVSRFVSEWSRVQKYASYNLGYVYNMRQNEQEFKQGKNRIRDEFGISETEILIVSTGRIIKDKGFDVLTDAIIEGKNWNNTKFLIVGDGSYLEEMKCRIADAGLCERVFFSGYRNDVAQILEESDIFVLCTLHETLCNSVVEASYANLPVVATNTGGIPEIIEDGVTGFLTEKYDYKAVCNNLQMLVADEQLRTKMGKNGRVRIDSKFSSDEITEKIDSFYKAVLRMGDGN